MSETWIQAINIVHLEKNGETKDLLPGMWDTTGKHQARELVVRGDARIVNAGILRDVLELTDCTIFVRGTILDFQRSQVAAQHPGVPILSWSGYPGPEVGRFLLWDMSSRLRPEMIVTGFDLLNTFQFVCPLLNYDTLAGNIGTEKDRAATKAIIHDLRVPVYNPKVIFARQGEETRKLFSLWDNQGELSFLRAIYQARALTLALPPSWIL